MKPIFALATSLAGLVVFVSQANAAFVLTAERPTGGIQVPPPQDDSGASAPTGGIQPFPSEDDLELSPAGGLQAPLPPCPKGKRRARREGRIRCVNQQAKANQSRRAGR